MKINYNKYLVFLMSTLILCLNIGCEQDEHYDEYIHSPVIAIEKVSKTDPYEIQVVFTPNKYVDHFNYAIGAKSDRESFENGSFTGIHKQVGSDEFTHTFTYLDADENYIIYAQAFDKNGEASGLAMLSVKTYTDEFKVELDRVTVTGASIKFESSSNYYAYTYALGTKSDRESFENGSLENIQEVNEQTSYTANFLNLNPSSEYVVFARGYDRGNNPTKVYEFPFKTLSEKEFPKLIKSSVSFTDFIFTDIHVEVNEHTSKVGLFVATKGSQDDMINIFWRGQLFEMLSKWASDGLMTYIGNGPELNLKMQTIELFLSESPFNRPHEVYALLYDKEGNPFSVEIVEFETPSFDETAQPSEVNVEIYDITPKGATYKFTPNEHTVGYVYETFEADWFDQQKENGVLDDKKIAEHLKNNFVYGAIEKIHIETTAYYPGQRLYLIVAGINKNAFSHGMSEFVIKEYTSTLE